MTNQAILAEINWLQLQGFNATAEVLLAMFRNEINSQPQAGHDLDTHGSNRHG